MRQLKLGIASLAHNDGGAKMTKRSIDDASENMRKIWLAYEYPGQIVRRDFARLGRMLKRAYVALAGRDRRRASEEERESHLWAERRE
jgi:hypothetical protein